MKLTVRTYSGKELTFNCASFQTTNGELVVMDDQGIAAVFAPSGWLYTYMKETLLSTAIVVDPVATP